MRIARLTLKLLAIVCFLVSCVPVSGPEPISETVPAAVQEAAGTPIFVGTRLAATRVPAPTLPDDLVRTFDQEQCPDWCWHGVMLGQTEAEVLEAIRQDASVDRSFEFQEGDYVRIEHFENGHASIGWLITGVLDTPLPGRWHILANAFFNDGVVTSMIIPLRDTFPVTVLFEELGEPDLIGFHGNNHEPVVPVLTYIFERAQFLVQTGEISYLTGQSPVESMRFKSEEALLETICIAENYYVPWDGLGSLVKYFPGENQPLIAPTLPEVCP